MQIKIIHLIDSLNQINFGIWNAVSTNFPYFISENHVPEIWFESGDTPDALKSYLLQKIENDIFKRKLMERDPKETIVISHGCWKGPTKWGYEAKQIGFPWIALPHGMLEPWSMRQKWLKKKIYFYLVEKDRLQKADKLIAVSQNEQTHLEKTFKRSVVHIPNGIDPHMSAINKPHDKINFLFMARLHHKKGVMPLLKAWSDSVLANDMKYCLNIAGPDHGEQAKMEELLKTNQLSNVNVLGPVYNQEKVKLLKETHIYMLPSHSEGFPTSILEAATFGCYPIFTKGCNFNEAFEASVASEITTEPDNIRVALDKISKLPIEELINKGLKAKSFVDTNYNLQTIGQSYLNLFQKIN